MDIDTPAAVGIIFGVCFGALALVFILIGVIRKAMARGWVRTTAIVINSSTGEPFGIGSGYPTFRWIDQYGVSHQRTSGVRQSFPPQPGARIAVKYDPQAPRRAIIDTGVQNGSLFLGVGIGIAGLGLLIAGMLLLFPLLLGLPAIPN